MQRRWLNLDSPVCGNIFTMDLLRRKEASGGRLLVLAVVLGWCLGSVSCFGQSLDSEFTFLLQAGRSECFFQTAVKNGTMEVEYQVIAGAGMDVDFTVISPEGSQLVFESRRSDGVHVVEPTVEGDYEICFDNSFSRFSEKMVFFEIIIEGQGGDVGGDEEWPGLDEPDGSLLEYKLEDIRVRSPWTLCTDAWSAAGKCRLCCGLLRHGTETFWKTTCGGSHSGPAPVCW
ncbi:transmembrane emp24 domain-containing protein 1b isoform X2 [Epinephelus moara]|uniref:transmembrane emp24 domain-containing protein 1b isoform X2 n=1 Tax=Epinephelus moara TaxID=300413 RepID=UPI00214EDB12|nr:transmembrane emp24 domain-containing protein 1b isoform X2 [Epinephelus moara]